MRVTLLGTGSAFPARQRVQTGTLIERDGASVLVDCGSGVLHRLASVETASFLDIDTVLLTHHHLDHVSDLPGLFKARILKDHPEFTVVGPPGTEAVCRSLFAVDELLDKGSAQIEERDADESPFDVGGFTVEVAEGTHAKRSYAYRFGDDLVLSGDTTVDADVIRLADGVDTLVHECSYPDEVSTETHTTPTPLGEAVREIHVERLYLTHLFPETEAVADEVLSTVRGYTDAEVRLATDLTSFVLPR